jgi:hypothetical protein
VFQALCCGLDDGVMGIARLATLSIRSHPESNIGQFMT